jgi:hypothetical protein
MHRWVMTKEFQAAKKRYEGFWSAKKEDEEK